MKESIDRVLKFIGGLFSDNGSPSSSRVLTFILAVFDMIVIWGIFRYLKTVHDPMLVASWMGNLPMVIGALTALAALPYTVNRGTNALSDIMGAVAQLKGKL